MDVKLEPEGSVRDPSSPTVDAMFDEFTTQTDDSMLDDFATLSPSSSNGDMDAAATPSGAPSTGSLSDSNNTSTSNVATTTPPTSQPSLSRRGSSRKSTMTQQQKNNKRQRATTEQLAILETEFSINPAPNGKTRLRIADQINMTERSVQIWFQNRRAKIKLLAKKSIETGGDTDLIPDSMKHYLAVQSTGPGSSSSSAYFARAFGLTSAKSALGRSASFSGMADSSFILSGSGGMILAPSEVPPSAPAKTLVNRFTCRSLSIGTWRRVGCTAMDLVIFYSPSQSRFTYYINNDSIGFKIEYPFSYVKQIYVEGHAQTHKDIKSESKELGSENTYSEEHKGPEMGDIVVVLARPPQFFMESSSLNGGWFDTEDFTEDQQASKVMEHRLTGPLKVLEQQLAELLCLKMDTTRNNRTVRSNSSGSTGSNTTSSSSKLINASSFTTSAPVSPLVANAPTSVPTSVAALAAGGYADESFGFPPRGNPSHMTHRRTRSRSVPVAIDFSYLGPSLTPGFSFHPGAQQHALSALAHPTPSPPGVPSTQIPVSLPVSMAVSAPVATPTPAVPSNMMGLQPDLPQTASSTPTPAHDVSLRIDTTAPQYLDVYPYPMSAASDTAASGFHGPAVLGTPLIQAPMGGVPATSVPQTPSSTSLTGDMVNLNPYTMTNMWVDRSNAVYQTSQGYDMDMTGVFGGTASATGGGQDVVMPDNGGADMFQTNFVKPNFIDAPMEGVSVAEPQIQTDDELVEFGTLGISGGPPGPP
ncbi:hypothetical protein POJ06DRAFT_293654 [Lipomyces tetrasporus]|uniref:Homeobox domain-containing protein n=1 Tax=Lipomyces tetrasporus TaxID=54092 RepID=A0AAD7QYS9_9ASCO|nr:uncharacterized protein POJ06DRAFT_293654 [Lipomyces tetrasporus]KAJ8103940.1 hypothetical protein POJ06DRAFT_293654 [Lipomyces tetrasporus]